MDSITTVVAKEAEDSVNELLQRGGVDESIVLFGRVSGACLSVDGRGFSRSGIPRGAPLGCAPSGGAPLVKTVGMRGTPSLRAGLIIVDVEIDSVTETDVVTVSSDDPLVKVSDTAKEVDGITDGGTFEDTGDVESCDTTVCSATFGAATFEGEVVIEGGDADVLMAVERDVTTGDLAAAANGLTGTDIVGIVVVAEIDVVGVNDCAVVWLDAVSAGGILGADDTDAGIAMFAGAWRVTNASCTCSDNEVSLCSRS